MDHIQIWYKSGKIERVTRSCFLTLLEITNLKGVHKISWNEGTFIPKFKDDIWLMVTEEKIQMLNPLYGSGESKLYWINRNLIPKMEIFDFIYDQVHDLEPYNTITFPFPIDSSELKKAWVFYMTEKFPNTRIDELYWAELIVEVHTHEQFIKNYFSVQK